MNGLRLFEDEQGIPIGIIDEDGSIADRSIFGRTDDRNLGSVDGIAELGEVRNTQAHHQPSASIVIGSSLGLWLLNQEDLDGARG